MSTLNRPAVNDASQAPVALIQDVVAKTHKISRAALLSYRRDAEASQARHEAMWLTRQLTALSMPKIGAQFGRDHTTVLSAVAKVEEQRADEATARRLEAMMRSVVGLSAGDAALPADLDPVGCAERVALGGARQAMALSTLDVVAVCLRATMLEDLAGGVFAMLANTDRLQAARGTADEAALIESNQALIAAIAGSLEALGYQQESENGQGDQGDQEVQDAGAGVQPAGAAQ